MSAVAKKKLCWNCDGNVSTENDNCSYCGVYLHATDDAEMSRWNPDYKSSSEEEEIPSPLYQIQQDEVSEEVEETSSFLNKELLQKLKLDLGPLLLLMAGSVFFLFGVILLLFAQDGLLTLQWSGSNWIYFLGLSLPTTFVGWRLLQQIEKQ